MSTLTKEVIKVAELSKYGVKVGNEYVNYSKQLPEAVKGIFVPGGTYAVDFYVADSGKRYINAATAVVSDVPKAEVKTKATKSVSPKEGVRAPAEISKGLSKAEWQSKDERISHQGLLQAALIALAPVVALEVLFDEAVKIADKGFAYVNGVK